MVVTIEHKIDFRDFDTSIYHQREEVEFLKSTWQSRMSTRSYTNNQTTRDEEDKAFEKYFAAEKIWLESRKMKTVTIEFGTAVCRPSKMNISFWEDSYSGEIAEAIKSALKITVNING